jgi:integrase
VKEAGENWILSGKAAGLERSTLDQYQQHLDLHIVPFIGRMKLSDLSVPCIRKFQDELRKQERSPGMVKRVTVSLGSILADAQERGHVARNVVREMTQRRARGKARHGERRQKAKLRVGIDIPTRAEIRSIVDALAGRWRPLIITAIFTGLRASELRGLRWVDVDLKNGLIHVRQRADRYHTIGMPKSDAGQRTVPVPPIVMNTLKEWKLICPRRGKTETTSGELHYVFPNGKGHIEWHGNIINRGLIPAQVAACVCFEEPERDDCGMLVLGDDGKPQMVKRAKYPGLHAFRHFYASWCINRRVDCGLELPPKMVQERMGHSSIRMTMDVYGHLFPSSDDAGALAAAERELLAVSPT